MSSGHDWRADVIEGHRAWRCQLCGSFTFERKKPSPDSKVFTLGVKQRISCEEKQIHRVMKQ